MQFGFPSNATGIRAVTSVFSFVHQQTDKRQNYVMYFQAVMDFFVKIQMFPWFQYSANLFL